MLSLHLETAITSFLTYIYSRPSKIRKNLGAMAYDPYEDDTPYYFFNTGFDDEYETGHKAIAIAHYQHKAMADWKIFVDALHTYPCFKGIGVSCSLSTPRKNPKCQLKISSGSLFCTNTRSKAIHSLHDILPLLDLLEKRVAQLPMPTPKTWKTEYGSHTLNAQSAAQAQLLYNLLRCPNLTQDNPVNWVMETDPTVVQEEYKHLKHTMDLT